jgi:hypothetical protein
MTDPPETEIARWKETVARQPTADNWNELSFAYIKAGNWQAAVEAGNEALNLKRDHPYALYNTGLALVRSDKAMAALSHLKRTAGLQPDRHEPVMVLAQAYQQLGHHRLATYYAQQAVTLAKGDQEALQTERSVAEMLTPKPPIELATVCVRRLSDGPFSLCLYEEPGPEQTVDRVGSAYPGRRYTLWYGTGGNLTNSIPVGYTQPGEIVAVTLPGGVKGYWLPGGPVGALVAGTMEWRLFARVGAELRQILFLGGDRSEGGDVSDFMRARSVPEVNGDEIRASHRDDVTGSRMLTTIRRISLAEGTVTVVAEEESVRGPLTQLTPKVEVEANWSYKWAYNLSDGARILVDGQPATLADLKIGMFATITVKSGKIVQLDARK